MKKLFFRFFYLLTLVICFPWLLISLTLATIIIPVVLVLDFFLFLFTGSFKLAGSYILNYYDKVAFHWFYVLELLINKYL